MNNKYIYSHNSLSSSCANLAKELGIQRIRHERSNFTGGVGKTVINWGAQEISSEISRCIVINQPFAIRETANKLVFFQALIGKNLTPNFTTHQDVAKDWLDDHRIVVARKLLNSSGGKGIVLMQRPCELIRAPLYVQYIPKKFEYRVHILSGKVIDVQIKRRRLDFAEPNWKIRNYNQGFIYAREGCFPHPSVLDVALKCFDNFQLHFGAIDVVYNEKTKRAYVLEINTAPGLEGQTVVNYANALRKYLG